jgi:hypothetical protein
VTLKAGRAVTLLGGVDSVKESLQTGVGVGVCQRELNSSVAYRSMNLALPQEPEVRVGVNVWGKSMWQEVLVFTRHLVSKGECSI